MTAMQEEIFGPVLPVKTYKAVGEAIDYVNEHDRPLGLYYFGEDSESRTRSWAARFPAASPSTT